MSMFLLTNAGPSGAWSPTSLGPALRPTVVVSVSRSRGILWQDAAKTVKATANGDPVRVATCPFTGKDFAASSSSTRPILHTDGLGHWWLAFDGVDDLLAGPAEATLSGAQSVAVRAAQTVASGASRIIRSQAINALIALQRSGNCVYVNGNVHNLALVADANPHSVTLSKAAGGNWALWLDGVSTAVDGPVTTDFGQYGLGAGGFGSPSETFTGNLYGLIPAATQLSAAQRAAVEAYLKRLSP